MNLYSFIEKYGDFSYFEKDICEVDILIYSQLSYLSLLNIDFSNDKKYSIEELSKLIDQKIAKNYIFAQKKALDILNSICHKKRFKDALIFNYSYDAIDDMQFGAITILLPNKEVIVSFEGTDNTIAGWMEDAILSYKYPTPSQVKAGTYLNQLLPKVKGKIIVTGHSKGANLALVGSMRTNIFKRRKIKSIYSFDGPGLRKSEFTSFSYKSVRKKLKNIVPSQSLVGVLFHQENLDVIKSTANGIMQHAATSWVVEDDHFIRCHQEKISIELDEVISNWLEKYSDAEKEKIVTNIYSLFEDANLTKIHDLTDNKIKSIYKLVRSSKIIDNDTKLVIFNCLKVLIGGIGSTIINEEINNLKSKLNFFR